MSLNRSSKAWLVAATTMPKLSAEINVGREICRECLFVTRIERLPPMPAILMKKLRPRFAVGVIARLQCIGFIAAGTRYAVNFGAFPSLVGLYVEAKAPFQSRKNLFGSPCVASVRRLASANGRDMESVRSVWTAITMDADHSMCIHRNLPAQGLRVADSNLNIAHNSRVETRSKQIKSPLCNLWI